LPAVQVDNPFGVYIEPAPRKGTVELSHKFPERLADMPAKDLLK
jgi:hypothetical protein